MILKPIASGVAIAEALAVKVADCFKVGDGVFAYRDPNFDSWLPKKLPAVDSGSASVFELAIPMTFQEMVTTNGGLGKTWSLSQIEKVIRDCEKGKNPLKLRTDSYIAIRTNSKKELEQKIYLVLHNIRSLHNVGSIFRTAEGLGAKKIYLTGYTPEPYDIFGKLRKDFAKTALGAEKYLEREKEKNIFNLIKRLKKEKTQIIALEQSKKSISLKQFRPKKSLALILGNEVTGLSPAILKKCDKIIEIPMRGKKESLNVSVAAGIAVYELISKFGD